MAKVRDDEGERSISVGERDGDVENRASGTDVDHRVPAFDVLLSAPWGAQLVRCNVPARLHEVTRVVEDRSRVHEEWIRQDARTKRLALIIGAILFVAGCQVIVFAPSGRETVAAIVGAAMLVVAAGTAGYRRVWGRTPLIAIGAGDTELTTASTRDIGAQVERARRKQRRSSRRPRPV